MTPCFTGGRGRAYNKCLPNFISTFSINFFSQLFYPFYFARKISNVKVPGTVAHCVSRSQKERIPHDNSTHVTNYSHTGLQGMLALLPR